MNPKKSLVRVVRSADGVVSVDPTGKLSGKGAYLCRNAECIEKAVKTGAIRRALDAEASASVYEELQGYAK